MKTLFTAAIVLGTVLVLQQPAQAFFFGGDGCCRSTCCERTCYQPTCCSSSGWFGGIFGW